jgi:hypothetical protein
VRAVLQKKISKPIKMIHCLSGQHTVGQPDNAEYLLKPSQVTVEACLAVHNDWYDDGISWHDVACYHKKPFVCEDSEALMRKARQLSPSVPIR